LTSRLLPRTTWLRPWALLHLHLHARSIRRFASTRKETVRPITPRRVTLTGLEGIVDHLRSAVTSLQWRPAATEWGDYESTHGYDAAGQHAKRRLVADLIAPLSPKRVIDLG